MSVNRTLSRYVRALVSDSSASSTIKFSQIVRNITSSVANSTCNNNNNSNITSGCLNNNQKVRAVADSSVLQSPYPRRNLAPRSHNYTTALSNMTKDQANDLVFRLNDQERQLLYQVLQKFQSVHEAVEGK